MRELLEALESVRLVAENAAGRIELEGLEDLWPDELHELCEYVELLELLVKVCRSRQHGRSW